MKTGTLLVVPSALHRFQVRHLRVPIAIARRCEDRAMTWECRVMVEGSRSGDAYRATFLKQRPLHLARYSSPPRGRCTDRAGVGRPREKV